MHSVPFLFELFTYIAFFCSGKSPLLVSDNHYCCYICVDSLYGIVTYTIYCGDTKLWKFPRQQNGQLASISIRTAGP